MDINGCQVVSEPADTGEGFLSTVHHGQEMRGPFETIREAVACAQTWSAEIANAGLRAVEDAAPASTPTDDNNHSEPLNG